MADCGCPPKWEERCVLLSCNRKSPANLWRVDVAGIPVTVYGKPACEHLESVNRDLARMKMALHCILHAEPEERIQTIARDGLFKEIS